MSICWYQANVFHLHYRLFFYNNDSNLVKQVFYI
uniref:Uncharacterized protein n=1 Tax=Arundo donax TaxID=35708 RepID=A0A0A9B9F2_ARUDO